MAKPALTAHQLELRAKLHKRCEKLNRQNETRTTMRCGKGCLIIYEDADDMPINCRSLRSESSNSVYLSKSACKLKFDTVLN